MWNLMLPDIPREEAGLIMLLELREHYMVYLLSNTNRIHWGVCLRADVQLSRFPRK